MSLPVGAEAGAAEVAEEEEVAVVAVVVARHDRVADSLPPEALPARPVRNLDPAPAGTKRLPRDLREVVLRRHKVELVRAPARVLVVHNAQPPRVNVLAPLQDNVRPQQPDSVPAPVKALRLLLASVLLQGN